MNILQWKILFLFGGTSANNISVNFYLHALRSGTFYFGGGGGRGRKGHKIHFNHQSPVRERSCGKRKKSPSGALNLRAEILDESRCWRSTFWGCIYVISGLVNYPIQSHCKVLVWLPVFQFQLCISKPSSKQSYLGPRSENSGNYTDVPIYSLSICTWEWELKKM